jgi:hypothetical protein
MKNLRAEHELLICIARKSLDERVVDRLRNLIQQNIDWDHLFISANAHGLLPLLAAHLLTVARDLVPPPILPQLRVDCLGGAKSNIYLLRELMRILELFNAESIRALAFKGPVLGQMVYGDVGLRQAGDLDILIAKEDFTRTKELLQSNSYLMAPQLTASQQRSHLGFHCEIQFLNHDQFSVVDLHWGLTPKTFPFLLGFEDLWSRRQGIRLAGQSIETFSNADLLLYLCVHGAKHYWSRLEWIAAIAELVRSTHARDWAVVLDRASETKSRKILSLGLLLASNVFALDLPPEVDDFLKGSGQVRESALRLEQKLFQDTGLTPTQAEMFRWNLQFMDRKRDAVKSFLRSILVPTISDWQAVQLPDAVYPLYYGLRLKRLVVKYGRRNVHLVS